jgi:hypothetical protein
MESTFPIYRPDTTLFFPESPLPITLPLQRHIFPADSFWRFSMTGRGSRRPVSAVIACGSPDGEPLHLLVIVVALLAVVAATWQLYVLMTT